MNWNAGATLRACLTALFASEGGGPPQVILVDNASTDASLAGLTSAYPALEVIQNAKNVGFARGESGTPGRAGPAHPPLEPRCHPAALHHWEDADFCVRFRRAGWGVYYVPSASGTHLFGISRAGRRLGSVLDFHVSAYRYYRKHREASALHPLMLLVGLGSWATWRCGPSRRS